MFTQVQGGPLLRHVVDGAAAAGMGEDSGGQEMQGWGLGVEVEGQDPGVGSRAGSLCRVGGAVGEALGPIRCLNP